MAILKKIIAWARQIGKTDAQQKIVEAIYKQEPMPEERDDRDLTKEEEMFLAKEHKCPICKTGKLLGGPCGGLSQNILCKECCSEFCYCNGIFATRLMQRNPRRALEIYGIIPKEMVEDV